MPVFSVSSEVHYIQKGFQYKIQVTTEENPDGTGTYKTFSPRLDYLSIPLLAKCRLDWESSSLYAIAGPRMDILLRSDDAGFSIVLDHLRSTEFGLTMGIGYVVSKIAPFGIGAEFRYSPTFQDSYATDLLTVRNSSLEMMLVFTY